MNAKLIRLVVIAGVAGAAWLWGDADTSARSGDPVVEFAPGDQVMGAAQAAAQSHLPKFLEAALSDTGQSKPDTLVKVAFPVDDPNGSDMGVEVIWVGPFARTVDGFSGLLANEPVAMPGYHAGSSVTFDEDMIRDWILPGPDGRAWGHYTTRVIAAQSQDENFQAMISQILMPDPAPKEW
ncbi:MAG: DUF2314 domain-containing protein [Pseudomonadota bacterium]